MCNFITILPSETIREIFSYVDQKDSVQCAYVCREWYHRIPAYSTTLWEHLEVSSTTWKFPNHCMIRCLGSHVQNVSIRQSNNTWNILKRLDDLGCGIIVLKILEDASFQDSKQQTDGIAKTTTTQEQQLLITATLNLFSTTLTQLTITNRWNKNVPAFHLLNELPNLTHLALFFPDSDNFKMGDDDEDIVNNSDHDKKSSKTITNLVYLHLDFSLGFRSTILPIIHRSPQLHSIILTNHACSKTYMDALTIDSISSILQQCPQLYNFMCEQSPLIIVDNEVIYERWRTKTLPIPSPLSSPSSSPSSSNSNQNVSRKKEDKLVLPEHVSATCDKRSTAALREIVLHCDGSTVYNAAVTMIRASKATLEYLDLENPYYDKWDFIFDDAGDGIEFPRLKKLRLRAVSLSEDTWVRLSTYCRHIEKLEILVGTLDDMRWASAIDGVGKMQHLQQLDFYFWGSIFGPDQEENYHPGIFDNIHLLAHCPQLHTIYFRNLCLSRQNLLDLTKIPELYKLTIAMQRHHSCNTADDLLAFADAMDTRDEQHKIRFLAFENCLAFNDAIHKRFLCIEGLSTFSVHVV